MTQEIPVNTDESQVPGYELPAVLSMSNGSTVNNPEQWLQRREEILELYRHYIFGRSPQTSLSIGFKLQEEAEVFSGTAIRKQVLLSISSRHGAIDLPLLMYLPKSDAAVPLFMGLNFQGNHTIDDDTSIFITDAWVRENEHTDGHKASERGRGVAQSRWPVADIIKRGYGIMTCYYGDIDPDFDDGFKNGAHAIVDRSSEPDEWATIAAWSWGLSRMMDYCHRDAAIDQHRVAVMGHSRLGKTALWAGAQDERFALVISNNSGCGGAALSRRCFGETIAQINTTFPHWFCEQHKQFNFKEDSLPVDQHMLIALQAPRPVYVASAVEDEWADPKGEFLSALHAGPVYELLGKTALPVSEQPALNEPVHSDLAYHVRSGGHDVQSFDWHAFMDFADKHL